MKKSLKLAACFAALIMTFGAAGCQKTTYYPDFKNPTDATDVETSSKYVVNVQSEGGMGLSDVQVVAKNSSGQVMRRGISKNGKIELGLPLGEYTLEVDESSLPAGYSKGDAVYKTNGEKRDPVTIKLPSKLIASDSPETTTFALGTIMRDFTFTDCMGVTYSISKLLQTKKAVVLNFFFSTCGPCQQEFPYLEAAYARRVREKDDVEVLAMSTTGMGDNDSKIATFKATNNLTFPMGIDTARITSSFNVSNFPTTVVIDRYGLIAYRSKGTEPDESFWEQLFEKYASDNYKQSLTVSGGDNPDDKPDDNDNTGDRKHPTESMPASEELEKAANAPGFECSYRADKDEYSWPWLAGTAEDGSTYIYTTNKGEGNSYSIVYADLEIKEGQVLTFEYNVSSEAGKDKLYVLVDGKPMNDGWSGETGWQTCNVYVSERDRGADDKLELSFAYRKDPKDPAGSTATDVAMIRNIHVAESSSITTPVDMIRECATGAANDFKYSNYVQTAYNEKDGFYHKGDANGPIIYASITQTITPWNQLHGKKIQLNGASEDYSLFNVTMRKYYKADKDTGEYSVKIGSADVTEAYTVYANIRDYMEAPYYLIPVTPLMKDWLDAFVADNTNGTHTDGWLEFCYYYDHFGSENFEHGDGEICKVNRDYSKGVTMYNPYNAYLTSDATDPNFTPSVPEADKGTFNQTTKRNIAYINFPMQFGHNGSYYKFVAPKTGVYAVRAYTRGCSPASNEPDANGYTVPAPAMSVYDKNKAALSQSSDVPRDFDYLTAIETITGGGDKESLPQIVSKYDAFNDYVTVNAGDWVYLYLETAPSTKTYYEFDIKYLGENYETWFVASTAGGAWTTGTVNNQGTYIYLGVQVAYDDTDDCYYYVDSNGRTTDRKVYIDMIHGSYFRNNHTEYNFRTLEYMINDNAFFKYGPESESFEMQDEMKAFLGASTTGKDESDELYGLVEANGRIVEIINSFIGGTDDYGDGRGWLAFAVYKERFGNFGA